MDLVASEESHDDDEARTINSPGAALCQSGRSQRDAVIKEYISLLLKLP